MYDVLVLVVFNYSLAQGARDDSLNFSFFNAGFLSIIINEDFYHQQMEFILLYLGECMYVDSDVPTYM